jgi:hypothetical protein
MTPGDDGGRSVTDLLTRVRQSATAFSGWIEGRVAPTAASAYPLELANWKRELDLIRGLVDRPERVRIALIGTTGAGKSSFLNAVLGEYVLPVRTMHPCTAFVTSVSHSRDSTYHATTDFCSPDEWEKDVGAFAAALEAGDDDDGASRSDERRLLEAARKRVEAVYGIPLDRVTPAEVRALRLPAEAQRVFDSGGRESRDFDGPRELATYLDGLVQGTSTLWPLITQVSLSGPFPSLVGGVELVDLPGLNDPNAARVEVTREFLRTSPFVWIVFSMVRGLGADVQTVLEEEKLLRLLVLSGSLGALSLIGTKADEVDANVAGQLGLPDDCTDEDLVRAYRAQAAIQVRGQLETMVRSLGHGSEDLESLERIANMAGTVRVHTTSANAFMKLNRIGGFRKEFGIHNSEDTGIPEVHRHLEEIGRAAGTEFSAKSAEERLTRLREEITFFFRGKAQRPTAELQDARARIQGQSATFQTTVQSIQGEANQRLTLQRDRFLEDLAPLLATSVHGVQGVANSWDGIYWSTLRAIVHRDGVFRSPSTGQSFDLNEALADPLLSRLPVTWERYFTHDLERVVDGFAVRLTETGKSFCNQVRLVIQLTFRRTSDEVEDQLRWFQDKVAMLATAATNQVRTAVRERRNDLAAKMPMVAKDMMRPAYESARGESGPGMKARILNHLKPTALRSAQPIFNTIQADLVEGLADLEAIIVGMFRTLVQAADEQARIVSHNANIDVDSAAQDPEIVALLCSMPEV